MTATVDNDNNYNDGNVDNDGDGKMTRMMPAQQATTNLVMAIKDV